MFLGGPFFVHAELVWRAVKLHFIKRLFLLRTEALEVQKKSFHNTEKVYGVGQHVSMGCIAEGRKFCFHLYIIL